MGVPAPFTQSVRRDIITAPTALAQTNYALTTTVNMTSDSTAHVKGAWVQLVASTSDTIDRLLISVGATSANGVNSAALMDIGVGASGAETVIIPDVMIGASTGTSWDIPVSIPVGSRIAARYQSARTSIACGVAIVALKRNDGTTQRPAPYTVAIGVNSATSLGTACVPAASNAKGSWAQLTSSCPVPLQGVQIAVGNGGYTVTQPGTILVDIGVGAAGSETVAIANVQYTSSNQEWVARSLGGWLYFPVRIPAGVRIAARMSNSAGTNDNYHVDVSLVGIPRSAR